MTKRERKEREGGKRPRAGDGEGKLRLGHLAPGPSSTTVPPPPPHPTGNKNGQREALIHPYQ